jgi:hypothetical protein
MIFESFPPDTKVWIYISSMPINDSLLESFNSRFESFFSEWKSHGENINGHFKVKDQHLLLIAANVNGSGLCGRAVDAQLRFIKELDQEFKINLLDRNKMAYFSNNKIELFDFKDLKSLIANKLISKDTNWCNTFVNTNSDVLYLPFNDSPFASLYFSK